MKTELIKIHTPQTEGDRIALDRAGACLRSGGLVIFPTETVYGLGADATDANAARRIYEAKGRPSDNPLIVHIKDPSDADKYAVTSPLYDLLATRFMPGPLTVIMPCRDTIPRTVTGGLSTVAIRCPAHPVAQALLQSAGVPVAAPSANLSGSPSPTRADHVMEDMDGRVDMILDGGESEIGLESTIVKIDGADAVTLLRPGAITVEMLSEVLPHIHIADAVLAALPKDAPVLSPGMKYRHYAPKTPLYLLDGSRDACLSYLRERAEGNAVLCYDEDFFSYEEIFSGASCFPFGSLADERTQAHRLFTLLREMDKQGFVTIYAPLPRKSGLGLALYNRMIRAAAHQIIHLEKEES